ncbi:hypothetical protein APF79_03570 [bacterium BRH_c32]|nr:MAG: hypothetical protein APF79_03570 [bacterium BRH_c32]
MINNTSEKIILKANDLLFGYKISKYLQLLLDSQWWEEQRLIDYQEKRLRELIKHSVETVPYYKDLFKDLKLKIDDIKTIRDLQKLPILNKSIIKSEGTSRFLSSSFSTNDLIKSSSSGSTGEPLFYFRTKDAYSMNIAANLRGWYWMDYRLGDKFIKLSNGLRENKLKNIQDFITRNLYLNTNPLSDDNFETILQRIAKYQPAFLRCYPDPLIYLSRYIKKYPINSFNIKAINTTGNTLFQENRREIEEAFGCKIFDSYGSEGNSTVFECPTHSCYHSAMEYGITEILDNSEKILKNGVGRLISTDLWNYAHPFIRYDTQDLIEASIKKCTCGRSLLPITKIIGRDNDVLEFNNGQRFIVHNFTVFFQNDNQQLNKSVEQFQIIKHKECSVTLNLIVNKNFNRSVQKYIADYWSNQFETKVDINIVDNIPLTKSNKRRFIINE